MQEKSNENFVLIINRLIFGVFFRLKMLCNKMKLKLTRKLLLACMSFYWTKFPFFFVRSSGLVLSIDSGIGDSKQQVGNFFLLQIWTITKTCAMRKFWPPLNNYFSRGRANNVGPGSHAHRQQGEQKSKTSANTNEGHSTAVRVSGRCVEPPVGSVELTLLW